MDAAPARFANVLARIRAFSGACGWTPTQLAREAGLSDTVTRGMDREDWAPSGSSILALEALIPDHWQPGMPAPADQNATSGKAAAS